MAVETGLMTFAEFEQLAGPPSGHYELHHGELVHVPPRNKHHFSLQQVIYDLLLPLLGTLGRLGVEFPFRPKPEHEAWEADVAFVSAERWNRDHNDYFLGAPDLVIEVLSKSNTMDEILDRQETCFAGGCVTFWTVDAKRQIILVTTADGRTVTYDRNSHVMLPKPYSGFVIVAEIFPKTQIEQP